MNPTTARCIARVAHRGQTYNAGDYFEDHICQVALRVSEDPAAGDDHLVIAYLHDVLEDTGLSLALLVREGLTLQQQLAMFAITRYPGEFYARYIERTLINPIAALVKYHDLCANIDAAPPLEKLHRYLKARTVVERRLKRTHHGKPKKVPAAPAPQPPGS